MDSLSVEAQNEIQAGRALPLEVALKRIMETVDEVVSYTIGGPQSRNTQDASLLSMHARIYFWCRLHGTFSMPLAAFCVMPGIVSLDMLNRTINVLKAHTDQTINYKR
jgi:hypothetical protein